MKQDKHSEAALRRVKLWDPALRVFHWLLVICVVSAWYLGRFGPDIMELHFYFGYAVLALLAFRLVWGIAGPASARFSRMIYGPSAILSYISGMFRREPSYWPGHNPVGSFAAWALLLILLAQGMTGLFSDPDDYVNVGPLAAWASGAWVKFATHWHHVLANGVLILVGLHLLAILFYKYWKREDLISSMITGWKEVKVDPAKYDDESRL